MQFLQTLESTSVAKILISDSPSFALIRKQEKGEAISQAILSKLIIDFLEFFNIGKTMSESQIVSTVKLLLEDYSVLKPDDFVLFFNRAKKGTYGKVYDRMDGQIIFEWLEQFMYDRDSEIEALRQNENKRLQKEITGEATPMPDYLIDYKNQLQKDKIAPVKELVQTEQQKLISDTLKQFEALWKNQGAKPGKQFVWIDGQAYDSQEYLEFKLLKNAKNP